MANLNRLKVVLVENQKTGKWLAEQLGKSSCTVSKWCSNTLVEKLIESYPEHVKGAPVFLEP